MNLHGFCGRSPQLATTLTVYLSNFATLTAMLPGIGNNDSYLKENTIPLHFQISTGHGCLMKYELFIL
jgi:hypothetical protein